MTLFTSDLSDHLTAAPFDQAVRQSYPGMAHFAGTGPHGSTCRECVFWGASFNPTRSFSYFSKGGGNGGLIKPHGCEKYRQMMHGAIGTAVPNDARACKYFEISNDVPARYAK